jgi:effector-binding domain-containing protein
MGSKALKLFAALLLIAVGATSCVKKKKEEEAPPEKGAPPPAPTEKAVKPQVVVDKAIKAHGGLEALKAKCAAYSAHSKGTFYGMPFTGVTSWKAPDKSVMNIGKGAMIMAVVGKECWNKQGDVVVDCMPEEAKNAPEMLTMGRVGSLYPLKDAGTKLEPAGTTKVGGKDALGVKVTLKGASMPVTMYFDKGSGLLVKMAYKGHWMMKPARIDVVMSGHKDFGGIKMATQNVMKVNGRMVIKETITNVEPKVDEAAFKRPPQGKAGVAKVHPVHPHMTAFTTHKGPYDKMGAAVGGLMGWIMKSGLGIMGPPVIVYVKGPPKVKKPAEFVTEIHFPIAPPARPVPKAANFGVKKHEAMEIAKMLYIGPHDKTGPLYKKLAKWIPKNGYVIAGPAGEVCYTRPDKTPKEKQVHELFILVQKKGAKKGDKPAGKKAEPKKKKGK